MGIKNNEIVDQLDKEASIRDTLWNNKITFKKIIALVKTDYLNIDRQYLKSENKTIGLYYLLNFVKIKFNYLRKIIKNKKFY